MYPGPLEGIPTPCIISAHFPFPLLLPAQHDFSPAAAAATSWAAGAGPAVLLARDRYAVHRMPHALMYSTWYFSGTQ